jgi:hypothetical protein
MEGIWIFLNFNFFSFLFFSVKAQAQKEKELSLTCGGNISKVQSYLVTLKEAEKDKDEGGKTVPLSLCR